MSKSTEAIKQVCKCGHAREEHDPSFPKCYGWPEDYTLPVVRPGEKYEHAPECDCKEFVPREG